ncbi:MAG TPA: T9SS type A sorting domain-containing protein [Bacteroidales bacterium]|nr:T9SS type A sorting domain-containing protein [Bacteroidales bacterium]
MIRRAVLYLALIVSSLAKTYSQEVISGLQINTQLKSSFEDYRSSKNLAIDTVTLPLFDDFSGNSVFPDTRIWDDANVLINNTYSEKQITKGIATFDALDYKGNLYETANSAGFIADMLTSKPVDLNYSQSAGIWLSFLFEAGGLSDFPETADSLTLQFYSPEDNTWYSVWRSAGKENNGFKTVTIPITNPRWLKRNFRFRFTNYSSLSSTINDPAMAGNCDIWNLDYVYLNINRNEGDTVYNDVAFTKPVRSLLKRYESMPWKQFKQIYLQEMGSFIPVHYRNNDVIVRNVTRDFEIFDVHNRVQSHAFTAGAINVSPQTDIDYNANLVYTFNSDNPDSALFRIKCTLKTDEFDPKSNDTITYNQVFSNYFAFDDGSSEGGYGINGLGSRNAMFAGRFTSFMPDTLRAVAICFNDSYANANKRALDIMIWNDNNGVPGDVLYSKEDMMVENGSAINGFYNYSIPGGVRVNGIFYVGWKQRSETFLNAGYDINTPDKDRQFYWLNGSWNKSQVAGTVMIRPVLGLPIITGISDNVKKDPDQIRVWPNPASDYIRIDANEFPYTSSVYISVFDIAGRELLKVPYSEVIDISSLPDGMYIIVTRVNGRRTGFTRLIKSK